MSIPKNSIGKKRFLSILRYLSVTNTDSILTFPYDGKELASPLLYVYLYFSNEFFGFLFLPLRRRSLWNKNNVARHPLSLLKINTEDIIIKCNSV